MPRSLRSLSLAVLLTVALGAPESAGAQSFFVDTSTPDSGAAGVPLTTQVRFDFRLPQDGRTWSVYEVIDFNTALRVEPRTAARLRNPQLLLNADGRPGVITYEVTHQPNTDYTWLVYDVLVARPGAGGFVTSPMTEPYVLRYTTAPTIGERTVSGTVEARSVAARALPPAVRTRLHAALADLHGEMVPAAGKGPDAAPLRFRAAERDVTHVYLLNAFTAAPRERRVLAATVIDGEAGRYEVDHVRPGTYWPLAVQFDDVYQTRVVALAYYDADGDQQPDPISVEDTDRTDVVLTRVAFEAVEASAYLAEARAEAESQSADLQLYRIHAGTQALPDGTAYAWTYTFATEDLASGVVVEVGPLGTTVEALAVPGSLTGLVPLPPVETTAIEAADVALADGGAVFLQDYLPSNVRVTLEATYRASETAPTFGQPTWRVRYAGTGPSGTQVFERYVDIETSGLVTSTAPVDAPTQRALDAVYPSPFKDRVTIRFERQGTGTSSEVRLTVYDVLGRVVRTLATEAASGRAVTATWDGRDAAGQEVPTGVYLVRFSDGATSRSQRMLLLR